MTHSYSLLSPVRKAARLILIAGLFMSANSWAAMSDGSIYDENDTSLETGQPPNSGGIVTTGEGDTNPPPCPLGYVYVSSLGMCVSESDLP